MERIVLRSKDGFVAINDIIIYPETSGLKYKKASELPFLGWKRIKPKYYKWFEDDSIIEIWFNGTGIIIDAGKGKLKTGTIAKEWILDSTLVKDISDNYCLKENIAKISYNNKDLMKRPVEDYGKGLFYEESVMLNDRKRAVINVITACETAGLSIKEIEKVKLKENNNGGATDYYSLPKNANTLQDLIEHRNMNGSVKDIFKACYRLGIKTEDELRDLNKMAYYSLREIGRVSGRKDYITIAKELIGSQTIEKE